MHNATPADQPTPMQVLLRYLMLIAILGFGVHLLLPQVGQVKQGFEALRTGRWPFLSIVVLGTALAYAAGAWMVRAPISPAPPWGRTALIQVAAFFASTVTPVGLGWVAVNQSYLRRRGADEGTAQAATGLNMVLTVLWHLALLIVLLPFLPTLQLTKVDQPPGRLTVDIAAAVAVAIGIAFWVPASRRKILASVCPILRAVPSAIRDPRRSATMIAGAVAVNLAFAGALGSLAAFGASAPILGVVVAYLIAPSQPPSPQTPGGLGAMEAALVSGLTRLADSGRSGGSGGACLPADLLLDTPPDRRHHAPPGPAPQLDMRRIAR